MRSFLEVAPFLVLVAFASFTTVSANDTDLDTPRIWALLVASSRDYRNYRHQADVCHAYHVLHRHGIPDERIVVMMYDDIANNTANPTPGVVINHPNGPNVYPGVPKDYTGETVTPNNFLKILKGDKEAMKGIGSGKVIESKTTDHVFVFLSDHGAPKVICFPHGYLHAKDLVDTLIQMHDEKRFAKLVFYLEACESGSMFHNLLPKNINVFASTAAGVSQSSYSCYFDDKRNVYLGDTYSVKWMEDSDIEDLSKETLLKQFRIVKNETQKSTVHAYGNLTIATSFTVSDFQGRKATDPQRLPRINLDEADSRDVPVAILQRKIEKTLDKATRVALQKELDEVHRNRTFLRNKVAQVAKTLGRKDAIDRRTPLGDLDYDCYRQAVDRFNDICFNLADNPYSLSQLRILAHLCDLHKNIKTADILAALKATCVHDTIVGII